MEKRASFSLADVRRFARVAKEEGVRLRCGYSPSGEPWVEVDPHARATNDSLANPWEARLGEG
jgi:hypothetical protein